MSSGLERAVINSPQPFAHPPEIRLASRHRQKVRRNALTLDRRCNAEAREKFNVTIGEEHDPTGSVRAVTVQSTCPTYRRVGCESSGMCDGEGCSQGPSGCRSNCCWNGRNRAILRCCWRERLLSPTVSTPAPKAPTRSDPAGDEGDLSGLDRWRTLSVEGDGRNPNAP